MTKGPRLQLGVLFAATVALGLPGGWSLQDTYERAAQDPRSSAPEPPAAVSEAAIDQSSPSREEEGFRLDEDASPEPQRPHPITKAHEAMSQRRELLGAAVSAIQKKEYESARRWLSEVDALGATERDGDGLHEVRGYQLIVDCLAARDRRSIVPDALREASKKYVEERRLPPRREVRRVCLEGRPFARRA